MCYAGCRYEYDYGYDCGECSLGKDEKIPYDAICRIDDLSIDYNELKAENKKLRELLQDVAICASGRYCYGCPHQYDGCDRDERMRELGIEVE